MLLFIYTLKNDGALNIETTFIPDTSAVASLARIGLAFEMPYAYNKVSYLGRGEHETYVARNQSGRIGIYHTDAERMFHYYVKPQATGNRTDVRWMELSDEAGEGLAFRSDKAFLFSVIPFTDTNVDKAFILMNYSVQALSPFIWMLCNRVWVQPLAVWVYDRNIVFL